jgi:hypothetical protein
MELIKSVNLALRFLLELCALAALAYWGFQLGKGLIAKIGLGIGAPLLAAVVWATLVAPQLAGASSHGGALCAWAAHLGSGRRCPGCCRASFPGSSVWNNRRD